MTTVEPIPELETMSKIWYNTSSIAFELINSLKFRETVFIAKNRPTVQRMLKINMVKYMYKNFERYKFYEDEYLYNMYSSVSHYPNLPMCSFKWEDKKEQVAVFNENYQDFITGYDLFIDLDNEDMELVYSSTKLLKTLFDKYKLPYNLIFSGTKGFHINIDYNNLPMKIKKLSFKKITELFKLFTYELKITEKIKDIDNTIYDLRRIRKTPYSIVYPYYNVALPLSDEEFDNFKLSDMFLPNIIHKAPQFAHRGLLTRQGSNESLLILMLDVAIKRKSVTNLFKLFKLNKETLYGFIKKHELI